MFEILQWHWIFLLEHRTRWTVAQTSGSELAARGTHGQGCDALQLAGIPRLAPLLAFPLPCCSAELGARAHRPALQGGNNTPRFCQVHWCFGTDGLHYPQAKSQPPQVSFKKSCTNTSKINHTLAQHRIVNPVDQLRSWQTSLLSSSHGKHNCTSKAAGLCMCNNSQGFWCL